MTVGRQARRWASTPSACGACSRWRRDGRVGPGVAEGHGARHRVPLQPSRLLRRGGRGDVSATRPSRCTRCGWRATSAARSSTRARRKPGAGLGDRRARRIDGPGDHHRERRGPSRSNFNRFQLIRTAQSPPQIDVKFLLSDNSPTGHRRTGAATDSAGRVQRDLRGHRSARSHVAADEAWVPLGTVVRTDVLHGRSHGGSSRSFANRRRTAVANRCGNARGEPPLRIFVKNPREGCFVRVAEFELLNLA
jgi:hypothetical protein